MSIKEFSIAVSDPARDDFPVEDEDEGDYVLDRHATAGLITYAGEGVPQVFIQADGVTFLIEVSDFKEIYKTLFERKGKK